MWSGHPTLPGDLLLILTRGSAELPGSGTAASCDPLCPIPCYFKNTARRGRAPQRHCSPHLILTNGSDSWTAEDRERKKQGVPSGNKVPCKPQLPPWEQSRPWTARSTCRLTRTCSRAPEPDVRAPDPRTHLLHRRAFNWVQIKVQLQLSDSRDGQAGKGQ